MAAKATLELDSARSPISDKVRVPTGCGRRCATPIASSTSPATTERRVPNHSTGASRSPPRIATKQPPHTAVIQRMLGGRGTESDRVVTHRTHGAAQKDPETRTEKKKE